MNATMGDDAGSASGGRESGPGSQDLARKLLGAMQDAVASKNLDAIRGLFDDEPVLFGTAAEGVGADEVLSYLERLVQQDDTLRWGWDRIIPLLEQPGVMAFSVIGTVGFDDDSGVPVSPREPFRLTCLAIKSEGRWRLRHFHGSVPQM